MVVTRATIARVTSRYSGAIGPRAWRTSAVAWGGDVGGGLIGSRLRACAARVGVMATMATPQAHLRSTAARACRPREQTDGPSDAPTACLRNLVRTQQTARSGAGSAPERAVTCVRSGSAPGVVGQ